MDSSRGFFFCVNQLSICGAVADLCKDLDLDSNQENEICESLVMPTEITNANATSQSSISLAQWNLTREYEQKFAELLDDQKLSKLCSDNMSRIHTTLQDYFKKFEELPDDQKLSKQCKDAGFLKENEKGHYN